jgi:hypothetical protein
MEHPNRRPNSYPWHSTSGRTRSNHRPNSCPPHLQITLPDIGDITECQKQIPDAEGNVEPLFPDQSCEKTAVSQVSVASDESTAACLNQSSESHERRLKRLVWRILLIVLPLALLSALLLGLLFGLHVDTRPSLFPLNEALHEDTHNAYILVNYSATRLTFVSSLLSLLAPFLGTFIMELWSLTIAQTLQQATRLADVEKNESKLPLTDEFRLVVGLILASPGELFRYFAHFSKRRLSVPPVLHKTAIMLTLSLALASGIFVANTVLQYSIQAINFEAITTNLSPGLAFGRGLSSKCLDFNRTANHGYPCTFDLIAPESEWLTISAIMNEAYYLRQNISRRSEIRLVSNPRLDNGDLAILIPRVEALPKDIDYRGSTVGVSTQCQAISRECNMQGIDPNGQYTKFNCTKNFWGVLGKPPNVTAVTSTTKAQDFDLPPMAFKPSQSLQFAFFTDPGLTNPYNTQGNNITTGNTEEGIPTLPDSSLINPVFVAVAGRFSTDDESAGSNITSDPGLFHSENRWDEFVLSCSYTTFEVNYTWAHGALHNTSFAPSLNGTLAEMYHGAHQYSSVDGGSADLQANLKRSALQNTSDSIAREWANLYSVDVLNAIGAYMTPRTNLQDQTRTSMLVTKVPVAPLAVLLAFSLTYVVLGVFLGIAAYRASSADVRALAAGLSLSALVATAFDVEKEGKPGAEMVSEKDAVVREIVGGKGTGRIRTVLQPGKGWRYSLG